MPSFALRNSLMIAALAVALTACGGDEKKPATQVAAKVNQEEISVHQINNTLARAGDLDPEQTKQARRQILDRLIDQELLVQKALEKKLHRDPQTMQAIEAARRELLARAYLEQATNSLSKPTDEEVKDYYGKHPELFGERRLYSFQEITAGLAPADLPRLREEMSKAKSLADVVNWLKRENIRYAASTSTKAAEQLPLELLPRFHQMKDGQIGVIPSKDAVLIVQLAASRGMPLDEKAARPFIEQFLANQKRTAHAESEIKALREKAKIEYLGEFTVAKVEATAKTTADAKPTPAEAKTDADYMDKGIAGFK